MMLEVNAEEAEPEFVDVVYEEGGEEEVAGESRLADEPIFSWLLRQAISKESPGDAVLLDYVEQVAQPLSEQLALKPAKGGQAFIAERLAEGKTAADVARYRHEQSMRAHLVNGLLPAARIAHILQQWGTPRFKYWDETVYRLFCAGFTLHDWVKLPAVEAELQAHRLTSTAANPASHLPVIEEIFRGWAERLSLTRFLEPIGGLDEWLHDVIYLAVNTQVRWGTMLNLSALPGLQLNGRARQLATDLCTLADRIAYIAKTPIEAASHKGLSEPIDNLSDGQASLVYHHVAENRGVLTNFIHNAALAAMQSEGCVPLLFAPSGVVYLVRQDANPSFPAPAEVAEAAVGRIRQACSYRIQRTFVGFSRDGKGLKTAPYYSLHLSAAEQIRLAGRAVFSQISEAKRPSSGKRFGKIAEKGWLSAGGDLELPDDIRVDQLAEFCALITPVAETAVPGLDAGRLLLEAMGLSQIIPAFEELAGAKNTGGTPYQWYYAAGYYLAHGSGRGSDPAQWREQVEALADRLARAVEEAAVTSEENRGWDDVRAYIRQGLSFGPTPEAERDIRDQITQELVRYQGGKRRGRKATTVCSLCSSAYTISPQREAGILFAPQVYTNKQPLHGSKAIRHICQICETEMMLRQILMNRGGASGGRFEGRKFRYLYLYPTYFFTPETLAQLRLLYETLKNVKFVNLYKALKVEQPDGPALTLEAGAFQRVQDLITTPEPPAEDRLFRLHFPEGDPVTVFFIGLPPPGRDAKDAEAWINPAWLALVLPLALDVKVVATESPVPLLHEAEELDETLFFDAPHDFVAALVGRERITLDRLLPSLQVLTVAYMVHMDGNANFSKGDYRWHAIPPLARRLAENPLWAAAYLKKWQRSQGLESIPVDRAHLYRQYMTVLEETNDYSSKGGVAMTHARQLTELYRQFYRHRRLNSNSILRPLTVASRAILDADPRLFPGREGLVEVVAGTLYAFMSRVESGSADGRLPAGSNQESRSAAVQAFANYFVGTIYYDTLNGDASALRGQQLNLLKNACEVIYRTEDARYWRQRQAVPDEDSN